MSTPSRPDPGDDKAGSQVAPDKPAKPDEDDAAPGTEESGDDDRLPRGQQGPTADYGDD